MSAAASASQEVPDGDQVAAPASEETAAAGVIASEEAILDGQPPPPKVEASAPKRRKDTKETKHLTPSADTSQKPFKAEDALQQDPLSGKIAMLNAKQNEMRKEKRRWRKI